MRRAALLQEKFDVQLLGLPWNTVLRLGGWRLPPRRWTGWPSRHGSGVAADHDFFEATALSRPLDVFACQLQTLGLGARVRRRYATTVTCALVLESCRVSGQVWPGR